jgi:hypothetical protein
MGTQTIPTLALSAAKSAFTQILFAVNLLLCCPPMMMLLLVRIFFLSQVNNLYAIFLS